MEEFQPGENTLAHWSINKSYYQLLSSLVFFVPLAVFLVGFIGIYFVLRSTNILLIIIPIFLFLPLIPAFKEFLNTMKIYKENLEINVTDKGIYVKHLDLGGEYTFLDWYSIKQYDIVSFPQDSSFSKLIPKPTRFVLQGAMGDQEVIVDAPRGEDDNLKAILQSRNISFGFKTE